MVGHLRMADTTTWMFGTSSDFSKEIIKNLDNPICFGRHNVDYTKPEEFISEHIPQDGSPVNIVVNLNIQQNYHRTGLESLPAFKQFFSWISPNLFFFFALLNEMNRLKIPVKVCYVTSTYGNTRMYEPEDEKPSKREKPPLPAKVDFKYSSSRLIQQSVMLSQISDTCQVLGVNPANLEEGDNISKYAKKIVELLDKSPDDNQWNRVYCLYSGIWFTVE